MRDRERMKWRHRQREKQAPCGEPNMALNPMTPGSLPEPKADAQLLSHPGAPLPSFQGILFCALTMPFLNTLLTF